MKKNNHLLKMILTIILLLFVIANSCSVGATDFYADISISVDESGYVTIEGITNHPDLLIEDSEEYTSKKQSLWLLNITKDDVFSDFVFIVTMPKGSAINYIRSSGSIRIEENFGYLQVKGFAQNKSLSLLIQYQIDPLSEGRTSQTAYQLIGILVIIALFLAGVAVFFTRKKKKRVFFETGTESAQYNLKGLNERQREIMRLLIERKRPLTQTDIQKELDMPKAAVSRNIRGLELKGLIEKERLGMSNLIRLKKP